MLKTDPSCDTDTKDYADSSKRADAEKKKNTKYISTPPTEHPCMIDNQSYRAEQSSDKRIRFLVFHYTALNFADSVRALTGKNVSAHYLIPDPDDASYHAAGFSQMRIFNLVDENDRAWHAGVSAWDGRQQLNDTSIGIEIVNQAYEEKGQLVFPEFHAKQISALIHLSQQILAHYPQITPTHVVGHSDIAPGRKSDPGAAFPWQQLAQAGIGAWYDAHKQADYQQQFEKNMPATAAIIERLAQYGYNCQQAHTKQGFSDLIRAFQLHFRPQDYRGQLDAQTAAILYTLVDQYCPLR